MTRSLTRSAGGWAASTEGWEVQVRGRVGTVGKVGGKREISDRSSYSIFKLKVKQDRWRAVFEARI